MQKRVVYFLLGSLMGGLVCTFYFNKEWRVWTGTQIRSLWHTRQPVTLDAQLWNEPESMVCLVVGQSNAANYGVGEYIPQSDQVFNLYKGKLYRAREPLLGADGKGSSVWTRVADGLIRSKKYKRVLFLTVARGSTSVNCWNEGKCKEILDKAISGAQQAGIRISHVVWQQGETDNADGMSGKDYQMALGKFIVGLRKSGVDAKIFVAVATYAFNKSSLPWGINPAIQAAQRSVVSQYPGVYPGPHVDSLDKAYYRYQDLHFSAVGLDSLANKWVLCIQ